VTNPRLFPIGIVFVLTLLGSVGAAAIGCTADDTSGSLGGYPGGGSAPQSDPPAGDGGTWWQRPDAAAADPDGGDQQPLPPPPSWSPDAGDSGPPAMAGEFTSAQTCGHCHTTIFAQWSTSMHSRALTSPVTIAQANQALAKPLAGQPSPDPQRICINCHSPNAALVSKSTQIPLDQGSLWKEGVSCETCHQFTGRPASAGAGYSTGYMHGLSPGGTMFGNLDAPVDNAFHTTGTADGFQRANTMCGNCHDVSFDNNHDGVILKGSDLVLQQTWDEYVLGYKAFGGQETCISCHMPVVQGLTRAADGASIPGQQKTQAPPRQVHDHSFVGVDYPLDDVAATQASASARQSLLQSAAQMFIDRGSVGAGSFGVGFRVVLGNTGTGHYLPSGFAFTRQMWLEVTARDVAGNVVGSSGRLVNPNDDLCDATTLLEFGNPLARYVQGCAAGVDDELVSFQQELVNKAQLALENGLQFDNLGQPLIETSFFGGHEASLQWLEGGVVPRTRLFDNQKVGALQPFEFRSFGYDLRTFGSAATLRVRLLFRNLPPYFLRALAAGQPSAETPQLAPLVGNVQTVEMARDEVTLF
jgi:hypothetical protein